MPNPVGADKDGEYIKIFNDGTSGVSLAGWKVKDASGKSFSLAGSLKSGQELTLPYSQTKINLNNNGETVYLYDDAGKLVDKLSYGGTAEEGKIVMRQELSAAQRSGKSVDLAGVINKQDNTAQILFIDFLVSAVLAGLALYIILRAEEKLKVKLF